MSEQSPRILATTGPLVLSPVSWVMDAIAEAGYDGVEVLLGHNPETRDPERLRQAAEQAGLDIPVVHGPYMLLLRTVLGANYIDKTRRALALTREIGAGVMVAHAPFRFERKALGWLRGEVDAEAAEIGAAFAMENLYPLGGRNFSAAITPEELVAYQHVVFDTSHFAVAEVDLFTAWDLLVDRVVHLHVSDNFGNGKDSHAPIGTGMLPLEAFLGHVGASGWAGTITLELDCRAYVDSRESLVAFLARERVKAEAMLRAGAPLIPPGVEGGVPLGR